MSDPTLFAAPEAASHGTAAGGTLDVTLALLLIVGLIVLLAWGLKRMRRFGVGANDRIQVLGDRRSARKNAACWCASAIPTSWSAWRAVR
jgi:flagellar biogenesis protein FliO